MTLAQIVTLEEVIDEALDALKGETVRAIVNWIRTNRRSVFDMYIETLGAEGLEARIRNRRKKRAPADEFQSSRNLCFDFGLPVMELDTEVSIPLDMTNLLYGQCEWKEPDDATIEEIDKHIALLEAQGHSAFARANSWRIVREAAAVVSHGRTDVPLRELRIIARGSGKS